MKHLALILLVLLLPIHAIAQDINPLEEQVEPPKKENSPFVDDHFPTRPLFGDTHLHMLSQAYKEVNNL